MRRVALSRRKKLLFAAIPIVLLVGALEIALRIAAAPPGFEPFPKNQLAGQLMPHPTRGYTLRPGFRGEAVRGDRTVPVRVNAGGFFGPELEIGKDDRVVLAVGDSITEGWGLFEGEAWPAQLEQRLRARGEAVRVVNAGVFGYGLREIRVTAEELIAQLHPRALIAGVYVLGWDRVVNPYVLHGGFAVRRSETPFLVVDEDAFYHALWKKPWLRDLEHWCAHRFRCGAYLLRAAASLRRGPAKQQAGPSVAANGRGKSAPAGAASSAVPDAAELRAMLQPFTAELDAMQAAAERAGIPFVALLIAIQNEDGRFVGGFLDAQAPLMSVVVEHCRARGIACVDTLPLLQERAEGEPIFLLKGDFHWSAAANAVAAEELARVLELR
jgi:lysophospholipase L1-like esterase